MIAVLAGQRRRTGMRVTLPPPHSVPWDLKPAFSATAGSQTLPDGRERYWVKHSVLKGVTPAMLVWWFSHLEGDVEIEGRLLNRYRVWHPRDHVSARYVHRVPGGSIGPGHISRSARRSQTRAG